MTAMALASLVVGALCCISFGFLAGAWWATRAPAEDVDPFTEDHVV